MQLAYTCPCAAVNLMLAGVHPLLMQGASLHLRTSQAPTGRPFGSERQCRLHGPCQRRSVLNNGTGLGPVSMAASNGLPELNKAQMQIYLGRIGLSTDAAASVDLEALKAITAAHLCTIPFENCSLVRGPEFLCIFQKGFICSEA